MNNNTRYSIFMSFCIVAIAYLLLYYWFKPFYALTVGIPIIILIKDMVLFHVWTLKYQSILGTLNSALIGYSLYLLLIYLLNENVRVYNEVQNIGMVLISLSFFWPFIFVFTVILNIHYRFKRKRTS